MTHDLHSFIQTIGQLGTIAAIFVGIPFCVFMTIKELGEQREAERNETRAQLAQPPANPTSASDARYDPIAAGKRARRLRDFRPNTPTKPKGRH